MSADGYAVIRNETLSWLLERARVEADLLEVPEHVALDLAPLLNLGEVKAPVENERIRALGPVLSPRQHEELLLDNSELDLPKDRNSGQFWRIVVGVVHEMMRNEAEAVLQLASVGEEDKR